MFYSFCSYCTNYPMYIKCNRLATITLVTLYCIIVKTILFKQSHSQLHHIQHSNLLLIITLPQTYWCSYYEVFLSSLPQDSPLGCCCFAENKWNPPFIKKSVLGKGSSSVLVNDWRRGLAMLLWVPDELGPWNRWELRIHEKTLILILLLSSGFDHSHTGLDSILCGIHFSTTSSGNHLSTFISFRGTLTHNHNSSFQFRTGSLT